MATSLTGRGVAFIGTLQRLVQSRLPWATAPQQLSCFHTGVASQGRLWDEKNLKVYPPQRPDEPRRPAEIYHSKRQFKYSKDKLWYLAKLVRGLSIDEAIAQLEFNDKKGAKFMKDVLLEAQEMAVKNHNVEFQSNLYLAESASGKGKYLKRIRYHGRGMHGIMDRVYCHYFVKLVEGPPPKKLEKTSLDAAREYVQGLKSRTIIHSL
ncbi:large ribosomal subunit protein uL22m [Eucyclogobius newberryi]|uniref:large ribosomal subunit protein uL22m n=1 Tax=Eucyclogobius newberryi TaxID=166745 RepID=UPI003B5CE4F6